MLRLVLAPKDACDIRRFPKSRLAQLQAHSSMQQEHETARRKARGIPLSTPRPQTSFHTPRPHSFSGPKRPRTACDVPLDHIGHRTCGLMQSPQGTQPNSPVRTQPAKLDKRYRECHFSSSQPVKWDHVEAYGAHKRRRSEHTEGLSFSQRLGQEHAFRQPRTYPSHSGPRSCVTSQQSCTQPSLPHSPSWSQTPCGEQSFHYRRSPSLEASQSLRMCSSFSPGATYPPSWQTSLSMPQASLSTGAWGPLPPCSQESSVEQQVRHEQARALVDPFQELQGPSLSKPLTTSSGRKSKDQRARDPLFAADSPCDIHDVEGPGNITQDGRARSSDCPMPPGGKTWLTPDSPATQDGNPYCSQARHGRNPASAPPLPSPAQSVGCNRQRRIRRFQPPPRRAMQAETIPEQGSKSSEPRGSKPAPTEPSWKESEASGNGTAARFTSALDLQRSPDTENATESKSLAGQSNIRFGQPDTGQQQLSALSFPVTSPQDGLLAYPASALQPKDTANTSTSASSISQSCTNQFVSQPTKLYSGGLCGANGKVLHSVDRQDDLLQTSRARSLHVSPSLPDSQRQLLDPGPLDRISGLSRTQLSKPSPPSYQTQVGQQSSVDASKGTLIRFDFGGTPTSDTVCERLPSPKAAASAGRPPVSRPHTANVPSSANTLIGDASANVSCARTLAPGVTSHIDSVKSQPMSSPSSDCTVPEIDDTGNLPVTSASAAGSHAELAHPHQADIFTESAHAAAKEGENPHSASLISSKSGAPGAPDLPNGRSEGMDGSPSVKLPDDNSVHVDNKFSSTSQDPASMDGKALADTRSVMGDTAFVPKTSCPGKSQSAVSSGPNLEAKASAVRSVTVGNGLDCSRQGKGHGSNSTGTCPDSHMHEASETTNQHSSMPAQGPPATKLSIPPSLGSRTAPAALCTGPQDFQENAALGTTGTGVSNESTSLSTQNSSRSLCATGTANAETHTLQLSSPPDSCQSPPALAMSTLEASRSCLSTIKKSVVPGPKAPISPCTTVGGDVTPKNHLSSVSDVSRFIAVKAVQPSMERRDHQGDLSCDADIMNISTKPGMPNATAHSQASPSAVTITSRYLPEGRLPTQRYEGLEHRESPARTGCETSGENLSGPHGASGEPKHPSSGVAVTVASASNEADKGPAASQTLGSGSPQNIHVDVDTHLSPEAYAKIYAVHNKEGESPLPPVLEARVAGTSHDDPQKASSPATNSHVVSQAKASIREQAHEASTSQAPNARTFSLSNDTRPNVGASTAGGLRTTPPPGTLNFLDATTASAASPSFNHALEARKALETNAKIDTNAASVTSLPSISLERDSSQRVTVENQLTYLYDSEDTVPRVKSFSASTGPSSDHNDTSTASVTSQSTTIPTESAKGGKNSTSSAPSNALEDEDSCLPPWGGLDDSSVIRTIILGLGLSPDMDPSPYLSELCSSVGLEALEGWLVPSTLLESEDTCGHNTHEGGSKQTEPTAPSTMDFEATLHSLWACYMLLLLRSACSGEWRPLLSLGPGYQEQLPSILYDLLGEEYEYPVRLPRFLLAETSADANTLLSTNKPDQVSRFATSLARAIAAENGN